MSNSENRTSSKIFPEDDNRVCTDEHQKDFALWKIDPIIVSGYHSGGGGRRPHLVRYDQKSSLSQGDGPPSLNKIKKKRSKWRRIY